MSFSEELKSALKVLDLPTGEYCLFGGVSLAIRNIRPTDDIDIFVTPELYSQLKRRSGWREIAVKKGMNCLIKLINGYEFEIIMSHGDEDTWKPKIADYIKHPEIVDGLPFMPLTELYKWKADTRRDKDVADLDLIDTYWHKHS